MSKQLNREEAWALLTEYNQDPFHLHHARTVEGVMRYFAQELGYGDEVDFWGIVGLLHDLDFERYPDQHCIQSQEIMRERDLDERLIHATASHGYGITVDIDRVTKEHDLAKRAVGYGIDGYTIDGNDVEKVYDTVSQAVAKARSGGGPSIVECKTYRQHGHNGGDPGRYRKEGELEYWKSRDPLKLFREAGYLNEDEIAAIEAQVEQEIQEACKFAVDSPYPDESDLMKGIFCE